jgi:hypothetical protein
LDHRQRQQILWQLLNGLLSAEEADRVGPIVTMTPAEATVKVE